jgi:hypothetical protein
MSQILAEALQDVQWAEEQLEAVETALLTRNCTQPAAAADCQAAETLVASAREASEARERERSAAAASAAAPATAPAALVAGLALHWPAAREQVAPLLQRFTPQHLANLTTRDHPHLHCIILRRQPASAHHLLQLYAVAEPQQLAGVPDLADFKAIAWSRGSTNHTGAPIAATCASCAAGLTQQRHSAAFFIFSFFYWISVISNGFQSCK